MGTAIRVRRSVAAHRGWPRLHRDGAAFAAEDALLLRERRPNSTVHFARISPAGALALLAAVCLASCGGGDAAPTDDSSQTRAARTPTPDTSVADAAAVCGLVTPAEAAAALGATPGTATPRRLSPGTYACSYVDDALDKVAVTLHAFQGKQQFEFQKGNAQRDGEYAVVPGIGDAAFVYTFSEGQATLVVLKGTSEAEIALSYVVPKPVNPPLAALGKAAAGRL